MSFYQSYRRRLLKIAFSGVVPQRRRNCYRIDEEQMNVKLQEDAQIFMILLTLDTFIIESHKIRTVFYWMMLVKFLVTGSNRAGSFSKEKTYTK
jgi:hypothetical protein